MMNVGARSLGACPVLVNMVMQKRARQKVSPLGDNVDDPYSQNYDPGAYTPNVSPAISHDVTYYEPPPSQAPSQVSYNYYGQQPQQPNQYQNPNVNFAAAATNAFMQARYPSAQQYGQYYPQYPFTATQQSLVSPNISNATLFAALGGAALLVLVIALR